MQVHQRIKRNQYNSPGYNYVQYVMKLIKNEPFFSFKGLPSSNRQIVYAVLRRVPMPHVFHTSSYLIFYILVFKVQIVDPNRST